MEMVIQREWVTLGQAPRGTSLLERVLMARGLEGEAQRQAFLDCSLDSLCDPFQLPDMAIAAGRLARAVRSRERVLVHGDYDADGLTATALLARLLRSFGTPVACIIPDRLTDGYGVSLPAIEQALAEGPASLLVTVDCGISAAAEIDRLTAMGIETIVTDHHECPPALPQALAVINPRLPGCTYPCKSLAGVGVAYKLAQALCLELGCPGREQGGLDLVAVGTVADIMPLTNENRILTANGLALLNTGKRTGLQALINVSGSGDRRVTATTIGFTIAPRLNAAGRMGSARRALDLLLTDDAAEAARLAAVLDALNRDRQTLETEIFNQAVADIDRDMAGNAAAAAASDMAGNAAAAAASDMAGNGDVADSAVIDDGPIVVARDGWHHGVVGIVASRLVDQYLRPVIVLAGEAGVYRGSGRTCGTFNLFEAIASAAAFTTRFGGHRKAAGLTLSAEQLAGFRRQLAAYGAANPDPERLRPVVAADLMVEADELTLAAAHDLERLMPFGEENREPLFIILGMRILEIRPVGSNGRTVKFQFMAERGAGAGTPIDGIGFGLGGIEQYYGAGDLVDVLFSLSVNFFNGRETCQMKVADLRPQGFGTASVNLRQPAPADFRIIYQYMANRFGQRPVLADPALLGRRIGREYKTDIDGLLLQSVLHVLADAGLVRLRQQGADRVFLQLLPATGERVRLQDIPSYRRLMARGGNAS